MLDGVLNILVCVAYIWLVCYLLSSPRKDGDE